MRSFAFPFTNTYRDRRVLVTGHTGFKGSWLCLWLKEMGAKVIGYSLLPPTQPNHFDLLNLSITSLIGDIRDRDFLVKSFQEHCPEIVFHLAAQPLVRRSYLDPVETLETNVIGTINVFEACRKTASVKAIVNITSDKCYENKEWVWGYRENDPMGGYDPYSASKGCAELVTSCYRRSFFKEDMNLQTPKVLLASARAGNVIGGGDWAEDRLIPDIMRATSNGEKVIIRNPNSVRPWQHVLEPLSGYLLLGHKLLEEKNEFAEGWNFGPNEENNITVEQIIKIIKHHWKNVDYVIETKPDNPHEAGLLKLDCSKARSILNWKPVWNTNKAIELTTRWYKTFYEQGKILSINDLEAYMKDMRFVYGCN